MNLLFCWLCGASSAFANSQEGDNDGSSTEDSEVEARPSSPLALAPLALTSGVLRPAGHSLVIQRDVELFTIPGAEATPLHTSMLPVGEYGMKIPVQTVAVSRGRVDVDVPRGKRTGALLVAPGGFTGITSGGRISMTVDERMFQVVALDGDALVGKNGQFRTLPANRGIRIDRRTGEVASSFSLMPAPTLSSPGRLVQKEGKGGLAHVRLEQPSSVRLALFDEEGKQWGAPISSSGKKDIQVQLPRAGTFRIVARALGEHGLEGPVSDPITVQLLGVDESRAREERGSYLLVPGESLALRGAHGLEMYQEKNGHFVPAPFAVRLQGNEPEALIFRDPDQPSNLSILRLAPKVEKARVTLGPRKAVWPRDPIAISVKALDVHGRPIVVGENFQVHVRVNFDEVDLNFTHEDGVARASLPPRRDAGPWVVRVTVEDEYGREVGRETLEVIKKLPPAPTAHDPG